MRTDFRHRAHQAREFVAARDPELVRAAQEVDPGRASVVSHPRTADLGALLEALTSAGVEFIVVGGAAAVLHGAPITTQDLDIVHRRTPENVQRLLSALQALDARFRDPGGRLLRPQPEHLLGTGQLNL